MDVGASAPTQGGERSGCRPSVGGLGMAESRATAGLHRAIPALPVRNVGAASAFYRERLGFDAAHESETLAVLVRDDAVLHLWGAIDDDWSSREDLAQHPICSGA